jgi:2-C-methyl-D-erythritol 4-phosphate cytidylyltransferase/2-C-methyl-D-erythritol 2,4-cyclodiphosphate synthase
VDSAIVLVAVGKGERLGLGIPKALVRVQGKTILEHALDRISKLNPVQCVVTVPKGFEAEFESLLAPYGIKHEIVIGGETRQQSVANGLKLVKSETVLIHDAARCFAPTALFESVAAAIDSNIAAVPGLAVTDTIKLVEGSIVEKTLDRSKLVAVQTPQGFRVSELRNALIEADSDFTDEAGLMESKGYKTFVVPGSELAYKVTTQADLVRLSGAALRTGIGTDAHRFSEAGELVLGCITWPDLPKLEGHSDGDSVAHAIVDALLSAAGLGDIGSNFGVDRPEFSGAAGEVFISETLALISAKNLSVTNVSVQVIADKPKIGPRRAELEQRLSGLIGAPVSVSATTTDGLGFLADSRGVAAVATALLSERG